MLTFLFWNLGGKALPAVVANLARRHQVDLLMLAECPVPVDEMLGALNEQSGGGQKFRPPDPRSLCERVVIYPRFSRRFLRLGSAESDRYTSRVLQLPGRPELLLFAAHLASKRFRSDESQALSLTGFSREVRKVEGERQHTRTILVGDLNMNPYESGVVGAEGLNAVMTREIASRGGRTVDRIWYPYFYNPMWGHFGDATHQVYPPGTEEHDPAGTCYYRPFESPWYFWNMFDQVLLRPDLLPFFSNQDLRILVTDGIASFLNTRGLPDRARVSDHLPLLFCLNL